MYGTLRRPNFSLQEKNLSEAPTSRSLAPQILSPPVRYNPERPTSIDCHQHHVLAIKTAMRPKRGFPEVAMQKTHSGLATHLCRKTLRGAKGMPKCIFEDGS